MVLQHSSVGNPYIGINLLCQCRDFPVMAAPARLLLLLLLLVLLLSATLTVTPFAN